MEKFTFFLSLLLISLTLVTNTFIFSQFVLAKNNVEKSNIPTHVSSNNYHHSVNGGGDGNSKTFNDALILLPFSAPRTTADLTSSFDHIINTQIYTGLNK
jgi:hypothetical protein